MERFLIEKQQFIISNQLLIFVSVVDYLFSPRQDRFGSETPSEASRIFFLIVIVSVSYWAWQISNGIVSIWLMVVILISTPILSVGWWLISLISQKRPTKDCLLYTSPSPRDA